MDWDQLVERVDAWLTLQQPVTYWSFWSRLLKVSPVVLLAVLASVAIAGSALTVVPFAPVPYVFVAATFGFAVRRLQGGYALVSVGVAGMYTAILVSLGTFWKMLASPSLILAAIGILTFVAIIAGFASPSLHSGFEQTELATERRERDDF
ncbi:MAG: hypothetical protein ABEH81_00225 [Halopenitus sp.]